MSEASAVTFMPRHVPNRAGVGLKAQHYDDILRDGPDIGWFEVHPENYMGAGGPPHRYLTAIRERYALSLHGVGLSIGSDGPLNKDHLARLKALVDRYQPGLFSEHLAWSSHDEVYFNDLLPVPYTPEIAVRVADHVDEVQNFVGRKMLLENPSTYVAFKGSTMSEIEFLNAIVARAGCGLLLDVNNVYVSATNHGYSPERYIDEFPIERVGEFHLGGHAPDTDDLGRPLLIDAHDRAVEDPVWALYRRAVNRAGPVPTLVEWDNDVPDWPALFAEAQAAEVILADPEPRTDAGKSHAVAG